VYAGPDPILLINSLIHSLTTISCYHDSILIARKKTQLQVAIELCLHRLFRS